MQADHRRVLREGYFRLRQESDALRARADRFEALPWHTEGKVIERHSADGWTLRVYRIESVIEACVLSPMGESWTYS